MCVRMCVCARVPACARACVRACVRACLRVCVRVCACARVCVCAYMRAYVCMGACLCVCSGTGEVAQTEDMAAKFSKVSIYNVAGIVGDERNEDVHIIMSLCHQVTVSGSSIASFCSSFSFSLNARQSWPPSMRSDDRHRSTTSSLERRSSSTLSPDVLFSEGDANLLRCSILPSVTHRRLPTAVVFTRLSFSGNVLAFDVALGVRFLTSASVFGRLKRPRSPLQPTTLPLGKGVSSPLGHRRRCAVVTSGTVSSQLPGVVTGIRVRLQRLSSAAFVRRMGSTSDESSSTPSTDESSSSVERDVLASSIPLSESLATHSVRTSGGRCCC